MGFKYLRNQYWSQITREERYFCSHLYHLLIGKEKEFVIWLNNTLGEHFNPDQEWEISFEVCFYRDFYKLNGKDLPEELRKRTFDLCLFSETDIIIIEAKVQQPFKKKQINDLREDVVILEEMLIADSVKITPLLLGSETFFKNLEGKYGKGVETFITGIKFITWEKLYQKYQLDFLKVAEDKYRQ